MSSIEIYEISEILKKNRTVVTGFSGVGFIANTALMHIIKIIGFKQVAYLHGNILPPLMVLIDRELNHSFRIYTDPSDELIFIVTEATIGGRSAWEIGKELIRWLKEKGIDEIIALEGFPFVEPTENLFGFTIGGKNLQTYNIQPLNQGAVSGINAAMLKEIMNEDIPWTTIFIPTRLAGGIDYKGAISAVQVMEKILDIEVGTEQLEQMSTAVATAVKTRQSRQERGRGFLGKILPR